MSSRLFLFPAAILAQSAYEQFLKYKQMKEKLRVLHKKCRSNRTRSVKTKTQKNDYGTGR